MEFKVYYFPFRNITDVPITMKNIEAQSIIRLDINVDGNYDEFRKMISPSDTTKMDKKNIRLKIIIGNIVYCFDRFGNGIAEGKNPVFIDIKKFEKVISDRGINIKLLD